MNNVRLRHENLAIFKEIQALYGWQNSETDAVEFHFWLVLSRIQQSNSSLYTLDQLCISGWAQSSTKRNTFLLPEIPKVCRNIVEFTHSHTLLTITIEEEERALCFNYFSSFTLDMKIIRSIAIYVVFKNLL